jgi:hypothetical protein
MGWHIWWLAVQGKKPDEVRAALRLIATDDYEEHLEADVLELELESGWYLICFNRIDLLPQIEKQIPALSSSAQAVECVIEEGSMMSLANGYADGRLTWQVFHNSQAGVTHLDVQGELPPAYGAIRDGQLARQAARDKRVDYVFDVPVMLAQQLVGYRHDVLPVQGPEVQRSPGRGLGLLGHHPRQSTQGCPVGAWGPMNGSVRRFPRLSS